MKKTRFLAMLVIVLTLMLALSATAFAADKSVEFDLEDGSIDVIANADGTQTVEQGGELYTYPSGKEIIITGTYSGYSDPITLISANRNPARITMKSVSISSTECNIYIGDNNAIITLVGDNYINFNNYEDAGIDVSSGNLTLKGNGKLTIDINDSYGAKIGSDEDVDMSGTIHITDYVTIITSDNGSSDGSAIGAGNKGNFTGRIIIDGHANVTAINNDEGAGIGAGEEGNFAGTVIIGDYARVYCEGNDDSAGIGTGEDSNNLFTGTIIIEDYAVVTAVGNSDSPAIGAAYGTAMDGEIIIRGNATVKARPGNSSGNCAIGSDYMEDYNKKKSTGTISILGNAKIEIYDEDPTDDYDIDSLMIGDSDYYLGKIYLDPTTTINKVSGAKIIEDIKAGKTTNGVKFCISNMLNFNYVEPTYTVSIVDGGAGVFGIGSYVSGADVTITAGARAGYEFAGWVTDNKITLADASANTTTFKMIAENVTVKATWKKIEFSVSFNPAGGKLDVFGFSDTYTNLANLPVPTRTGHNFLGWYDDETGMLVTASTPLTKDMYLSARWAAKPLDMSKLTAYLVKVECSDGGSASQTRFYLNKDIEKTLTFTPDAGYKVADVKVNNVSVGAVTSLKLSVTDNTVVKVTFAKK